MSSRKAAKAARHDDRTARMRRATRLVVTSLQSMGDDPATIRRKVTDAIAEALEGGALPVETAEVDGLFEQLINAPGVFRIALDAEGVNRHDQRAQETWLAVVQDELGKVLAG